MNTAHNADCPTHNDEPSSDDVRFPDTNELNISIIGPGAVLQGDIFTEKGISIFGKVIGTIVCRDGLLHVAETGVVTGNIEGLNVHVDGLAEGDVLAHHTLTIRGSIRGKMGYVVALFVDPNLDVDGHIQKVKVDTSGAFAPSGQQAAAQATPLASPPTYPSAPPAGHPYGHTSYAHVPHAHSVDSQAPAPAAATPAPAPPAKPTEPVSSQQWPQYGNGAFSRQLHRAA